MLLLSFRIFSLSIINFYIIIFVKQIIPLTFQWGYKKNNKKPLVHFFKRIILTWNDFFNLKLADLFHCMYCKWIFKQCFYYLGVCHRSVSSAAYGVPRELCAHDVLHKHMFMCTCMSSHSSRCNRLEGLLIHTQKVWIYPSRFCLCIQCCQLCFWLRISFDAAFLCQHKLFCVAIHWYAKGGKKINNININNTRAGETTVHKSM